LKDGAIAVGEDIGLPLHHYPLDRAADAHAAVESGVIGKVVIDVIPEVRHIIGQVPWNGDVSISSVAPVEAGIEVRAASGTQTIPCDPTFLQA